jgi:hypothetical protein
VIVFHRRETIEMVLDFASLDDNIPGTKLADGFELGVWLARSPDVLLDSSHSEAKLCREIWILQVLAGWSDPASKDEGEGEGKGEGIVVSSKIAV